MVLHLNARTMLSKFLDSWASRILSRRRLFLIIEEGGCKNSAAKKKWINKALQILKKGIIMSHTHPHTQREREREAERSEKSFELRHALLFFVSPFGFRKI